MLAPTESRAQSGTDCHLPLDESRQAALPYRPPPAAALPDAPRFTRRDLTGHSEKPLATAADLFRRHGRTVYGAAPRHAT